MEFDHVSLTYKGAAGESLTDITFRAMRGQTIGIIGGTGSGKSSLVNMIPRFYDATCGMIRIFGNDIRDYKTENLRSHIGIVPQKAVLFKGTIAENLRNLSIRNRADLSFRLSRAGVICPAVRSRDLRSQGRL